MTTREHIDAAEAMLDRVTGNGGEAFCMARAQLALAHLACAWFRHQFPEPRPGSDPGPPTFGRRR